MLQKPIISKYRPLVDFPGASTKVSGSIDLINTNSLSPGMDSIVRITFVKGTISEDYFKKGQAFTISEGLGYALGKGEILGLLEDNE